MLDEFIEIQNEILRKPLPEYQRPLFHEIVWKERLIGLVGFRGVGKTTLLLQTYKIFFNDPQKCLYISADHIKVTARGLYDLAQEFYRLGGQVLMIDEVHKYKNWAQEIKNIHDTFTTGKLILSGSSLIDILKEKGDLSRRLVTYEMPGLSFREYLNLQTGNNNPRITLTQLLKEHSSLTAKISSQIRVLKHFKDYLKMGYYPFYLEGVDTYESKLQNIIDKILYEDIPSIHNTKPGSVSLLKKIINLVATSQPFSPNIDKMSSQLAVSKEYIYHYLDYLIQAKIFSAVSSGTQGYQLVRKPEKVYLENPNLIYHLVSKQGFNAEIGTVRESFFLNQTRVQHTVNTTPKGDFRVDNKFVFEIGGKNKTTKQIAKIAEAHVVADDIETSANHQIPLWLFGFLY